MNGARLLGTALVFGVGAFLVFAGISVLAWRLFPYPSAADQLSQTRIWLFHVVGEKFAGLLLGCAVAYFAARSYRPTWKIGLVTGILAAVAFQLAAIAVYLVRFGFSAYTRYNALFSTMFSTITFAALFAFVAVWRDYRRAQQ
jgi:hypothetical protein